MFPLNKSIYENKGKVQREIKKNCAKQFKEKLRTQQKNENKKFYIFLFLYFMQKHNVKESYIESTR